MITTVVIFGSNGMLGTYLTQYLQKRYHVISLTREQFEIRVDTLTTLDRFLAALNISDRTCVINCVGLIPQRMTSDRSENDYYLINTLFPLYLARVCQKYHTPFLCPSTDCVYTGHTLGQQGQYKEPDFHDETGAYGMSKSLGEPSNATVIRASIIGEEVYNTCSFLQFVKNSRGTIQGWDNHVWNGITCYQYCKVVDKIIQENLFWKGVRHLHSPAPKTKYELACLIRDLYEVPVTIQRVETPFAVDKTLSTIYMTNTMMEIPSLEQQLQEQKGYLTV